MGVRGSRRRRDHGHSGEDSPPPPGARRGGELVTSPGYKELAASKDWDKHEQSSRSLATSAVGSAAGGGGGGGLSPRFLELLSPGRRGGGGGRGGAVGGGAGNAVQGIAAATAASLEAVRGMKMLQSFRAHTGPVWCAEFSRKGQYLATGGADGLVKVCRMKLFCVSHEHIFRKSSAHGRKAVAQEDIIHEETIYISYAHELENTARQSCGAGFYVNTSAKKCNVCV